MSKPSEHSRALQNVTERRFVRDAIGRRGVQATIAASLRVLGGAVIADSDHDRTRWHHRTLSSLA